MTKANTKPTGACPSCGRRVKTIPWGAVITCDEQNEVYCWQCVSCGAISEYNRLKRCYKVVGRDRIILAPGELSEATR